MQGMDELKIINAPTSSIPTARSAKPQAIVDPMYLFEYEESSISSAIGDDSSSSSSSSWSSSDSDDDDGSNLGSDDDR